MNKPENILIVRTDRIGDLVLTLPLAGIIKKNYPVCKVSFLVSSYTRALVENHPDIDNVIILKEVNKKISLFDNVKELRQFNFDSAIVVFPSFKIALIILLAGIKLRIGTGYRWYSFLFNSKIFEHRKYAEHHELEYNVNLLANINIKEQINTKNVRFNINVSKDSEYKIEQLLLLNNIKRDKPIIIIHPGSGGSAVDLPLNKFKQLISRLAQELNVNVLLIGTLSEKKICEELMIHPLVKNLAGEMELGELISLISKSDILVGNSSGPIHIASAVGKFVVGFYPKITACSPRRWGPFTEKKAVFTPSLDCSDCSKEQCKRLKCMDSIEIDMVFKRIKSILQDSYVEK